MDEIGSNPFVSILEKSFPSLYRSLFSDKCALLVPISQALVNVKMDLFFIETHVVKGTNVDSHFTNRRGQVVRFDGDSFFTSFGFNNFNCCNIIKTSRISAFNSFLTVYLIDSHLLVSNHSDLTYLNYNIEEDIGVIIDRWTRENDDFKVFTNSLNRLQKSFVLVPGYESETSVILSNIIDKSINVLLNGKKDYSLVYKRKLFEIALNYTLHYLHDLLWHYLTQANQQKEDVIQARIVKMRNELNLNLSLLILDSRHEVSKLNILPSVDLLHKMENETVLSRKISLLESSININNCSSEESISLIILAIVVGGLKHLTSHLLLMDLYQKCLGKEFKPVQILTSAIGFLLN